MFYKEARVALPDVTFDRELTVRLGRRVVHLLSFGRGNTAGDAVVYVPDARVVASGDLVVAPTPFVYDSHIAEWAAAMPRLTALDAAHIVPGHGPVMRDWAYARLVTSLLETITSQVAQAVARGLPVDGVRAAVDVSATRARLVESDPILMRNFDQFFLAPAIEAAYTEAGGQPAKK